MPNIGDLIREKRTEKKISQRKLAELCGMSYSHICRLEKGENIPTLDTITKISNALGVPPDTFTFDENNELSEFTKQSVQQFMNEEVDLYLKLIAHINDNYCIDKFDLSVLTTNRNFEDLRGLIIDVVKSRLGTYTDNKKTK